MPVSAPAIPLVLEIQVEVAGIKKEPETIVVRLGPAHGDQRDTLRGIPDVRDAFVAPVERIQPSGRR
jgi:hypothetical protein